MELEIGDLIHFKSGTKAIEERNLLGGIIQETTGHNGLITISDFIPIDNNKPVLWKYDVYYVGKPYIKLVGKGYSVWN